MSAADQLLRLEAGLALGASGGHRMVLPRAEENACHCALVRHPPDQIFVAGARVPFEDTNQVETVRHMAPELIRLRELTGESPSQSAWSRQKLMPRAFSPYMRTWVIGFRW